MKTSPGFSAFDGIGIAAVSTVLPERLIDETDVGAQFDPNFARRFVKSTGIKQRYWAAEDQTALDLCVAAASELAHEHDLKDVGAVIFVSQTPDYILPASAAIAQNRLGIPVTAAAFDINLGCSGYTYGLWLASSLISSGSVDKVLLLAGDVISKIVDPSHRATTPIFGDAGSATIIKREKGGSRWHFIVGTDGAGYRAIIVPGSGQREYAADSEALQNEHASNRLYMDGSAVFHFATTRVPEAIKALLNHAGITATAIDRLYLHQANEMILNSIARKVGILPENNVITLGRFGNTSSASIPLSLASQQMDKQHRACMFGFGVGLSWCGMTGELGKFDRYLVGGLSA